MNRRFLSLLLTLALVLGLLPSAALGAEETLNGSGTEDDPYLIASAAQLSTFRDMVNAEARSTLCAKLTGDIDLGGAEWAPFAPSSGYITEAYAGTFDGAGHTIRGLSINDTGTNGVGLFGAVNGATIKNLCVDGSVRAANSAYVGGIVGKTNGTVTIQNCAFSGKVTSQKTGVNAGAAGIVGRVNAGSVTVTGCANSADISGGAAAGILGYCSGKGNSIESCYNTGAITGSNRTGGISGQVHASTTITSCYTTNGGISGFNGILTNAYDTSATPIDASLLGPDFTTDSQGNILLKWQIGSTAKKDPRISIEGNTELYMTNSGAQPSATLTVRYIDMKDTPAVSWSISENGGAITAEEKGNSLIVTAALPGKATITATAGEYTAEKELTVWPFVTTVEIDGVVGLGQTVSAKINVLGGSEPDYEMFPLKVRWRYLSAADYSAGNIANYVTIPGAVDRKFNIRNLAAGDYLTFDLLYNGEQKTARPQKILTAEEAQEKVDQIPTPGPADTTINLGTLHPVFGRDSNIVDMVNERLSPQGVTAVLKGVKPVYGDHAAISDSGEIAYFYADPNTTPSLRLGSFRVVFDLTKDGETVEKEVPVTFGWDANRVRETMENEILSGITDAVILGENESLQTVFSPLTLPRVIDSKKWALISWTSSNESALSISDSGQSTADSLFDPYIGIVRPGAAAQNVTLTAACSFRLTDSAVLLEPDITVYKVFDITIPPIGSEAADALRQDLLAKLDAGLSSVGLTDHTTGEALDSENVVNDIRFPTAADFGVDGKYQPVTITSSSESAVPSPDTANAALVRVYRPLPGKPAEPVTITVTITDLFTGVSASRDIPITVQPLTREEIDAELALMEQVKTHYFDGIRGANASADSITTDLAYFVEVYADKSGELVWVRKNADRAGRGIVPVAMNGWEATEQWRLFRSSDPDVISHENMLVTPQGEHKTVTITSYLSSETLGKYAEHYPENADLQKLYYQPVSADLVVIGTAPSGASPVRKALTATFSLQGTGRFGFTQTYHDLSEGTTVFELFNRALLSHGYTYSGHGTYVEAITTPSGITLTELDEGENSGWMYRINGAIPDAYMGARTVKNGDSIAVFYTGDFTRENGYTGGWSNVNAKEPEASVPDALRFADVQKTAWYAEAVSFVCGQKLMVGIGGNCFAPNSALSRSMLAVILYRMENEPAVMSGQRAFDVAEGTWYTNAVIWGGSSGVIFGTGDGGFAPDNAITRQELAAMLYRYARYLGMDTNEQQSLDRFSDADQAADWGYDALIWASANGLLRGTDDGRLNPNGNATRAEAAAILQRFAALKQTA